MVKLSRRKLLQEKRDFLASSGLDENAGEIKKLDEQIVKSKKGKSAKVKGADYERTVAKTFERSFGFSLTRTPQSGGFAKKAQVKDFKGDIVCLDPNVEFTLHIECKNQKTWSLKDWLKQAISECPQDRTPVVVFHQERKIAEGKVSQVNQDYVALRLEDFFKLVDPNTLFKEVR